MIPNRVGNYDMLNMDESLKWDRDGEEEREEPKVAAGCDGREVLAEKWFICCSIRDPSVALWWHPSEISTWANRTGEVWWTSKHREDSKMQDLGVSIEPTKRERQHTTHQKKKRGDTNNPTGWRSISTFER